MPFNYQEKRMLLTYGWGHALIDFVSAALVFYILSLGVSLMDAAFYVIIYNVLAFGLQPIFGALGDMKNRPAEIAISGNLLAAAALFFTSIPMLAVCMVGIANALYHVGGGIVALRIGNGMASAPGLYVAPGAIGLFLGGLLGVTGNLFIVELLSLLILTSLAILFAGAPLPITAKKMKEKADFLGIALLLFLVVIGSRALVGFSANFIWKNGFEISLILVSAIALGKALGGILGDKFGWKKIAITALIIAAPLLTFGASYAFLGILGAFLFNFSMPITLTAMARMLPGWEGFVFGMTTLALIAGTLIAFAGISEIFKAFPELLFLFILASAGALLWGLRMIKAK
jgi:FSR family fosmidomycin resistance protein-like MFS transporter